MDDQTIDLPVEPKKPYTRPQLHELNGAEADGKTNPFSVEITPAIGPS